MRLLGRGIGMSGCCEGETQFSVLRTQFPVVSCQYPVLSCSIYVGAEERLWWNRELRAEN